MAESFVLAYSCAAARDSHPLPCLRPAAKTRVPKDILRKIKTTESRIYRPKGDEVKSRHSNRTASYRFHRPTKYNKTESTTLTTTDVANGK